VEVGAFLGPALDATRSWIGLAVEGRLQWLNRPFADALGAQGLEGVGHAVPLLCWAKHNAPVTAFTCPCPELVAQHGSEPTYCRLVPSRLPRGIVSHEVPGLPERGRLLVLQPPDTERAEPSFDQIRDLLQRLQGLLPRTNWDRRRSDPFVDGAPRRPLPLSPREWEVVQGLMAHRELSLVAQDLKISIHTARNHLKSVFHKLNVRSQRELLRLVMQQHRTGDPTVQSTRP
jgi:DNA-binding CsgD family transcriptional regulator